MVYYPQAHLFFNFGTLVVRVRQEPAGMERTITKVVHELDPELAVADIGSMEKWVDRSRGAEFKPGCYAWRWARQRGMWFTWF